MFTVFVIRAVGCREQRGHQRAGGRGVRHDGDVQARGRGQPVRRGQSVQGVPVAHQTQQGYGSRYSAFYEESPPTAGSI